MKRLLPLLCFAFLLSACREMPKSSFVVADDVYGVINAYIEDVTKDGFPPIAVIRDRTTPLIKRFKERYIEDIRAALPAGCPWPEEIYSTSFPKLRKKGILTKQDVKSFCAQLPRVGVFSGKLSTFLLDSTRICVPVMTQSEYEEMGDNDSDFWETYYSRYKGYCLTMSKPLFNADRSKVYFQTRLVGGFIMAFGELVVMERTDTGWKVIHRKETWIS